MPSKDPDKLRLYERRYRAKNREKILAYKRRRYLFNKQLFRDYYEKNKAKCAASYKRWAEKNRDKINASNARKRAAKLLRIPNWANHEKIRAIYLMAIELTKRTSIKHQVDHEIPLRGKIVSGLHVENNLRVIPAIENARKGTNF